MSRKTRKLIWSAPLVAAFAVIGALALFMTLTPSQTEAQANTAPGRPGTLTAKAFTDGTPETEIQLMWSAPTTGGSPTHYRIDQSMNGGNTWTALRSNVTDTTFLHTGLKAGQTFHYQVFAVNGQMVSHKSNTATATTHAAVKPEKPDNLVATVGEESGATDSRADTDAELTINLVWTAPPDPKGAPVLGYVVQYALIETPGSWTELMVKAGEFEFKADGVSASHMKLDAGRTYRYRVAAYNKTMKVDDKVVHDPNYLSPWASPDSATTLPGDAPDTIDHEDVRVAVSPAEEKIFLYWPKPGDPMGDPVNAYKVEGRPISKADGSALDFDATNDIANDTLCAAADGSALTNGCPWETIKDNIGVPSGKFIHSFEVTVRDVNNNTPYDNYFKTMANWQYRISPKNRSTPEGSTPDDAAATAGTTAAQIEVARSSGGTPVQFLTLPGSLRVAPSTDAAHHEGRTGLTLTWNKSRTTQAEAERDDAGVYRVEYSNTGPSDPGGYDWRLLGTDGTFFPAAGGAAGEGTTNASQTATDHAGVVHQGETASPGDFDEDLTAGQTRYYRVFALGAAADRLMSFHSDQKSGTTANAKKPEKPTGLTAVADSHVSIKLSWTAPDLPLADNDEKDGSEEGPSVIEGYFIQYLDEGSTTWAHLKNKTGGNLVTDKTTYTDTGLAPGASREYRVAAVNKISTSEQRSDWTDLVKGSTVPIPLPQAPTGLVAEATSHSTVDLTWLAQAEQPEHALVMEYVIEHSPDGKKNTFKTLAMVTAMTPEDGGDVHTIYTDEGLAPNTERHYRVYAKNARGRSDQVSNVDKATTADTNVPTMPMSVMADATSATEITVTWAAPANNGGSDVTGYTVERGTMGADGNMTWTAVDPAHTGMAMTYMDTGLTASTKYYYRVAASNANGMGEYSDGMAYAMTQAPPADAIRPTITGTPSVLGNSISVLWNTASNQGAEQIKVALFELDENDDVTRLAEGYAGNVHTINPAEGNPGAHTFTLVPPGRYKVAVANFANGMHRSIVSGVVTVSAQ